MLLAALAPGDIARVRAIGADAPVALRLREMGLRPGTRLSVAGRAGGGARVVAIGAARVAIDQATCALIEVEPA